MATCCGNSAPATTRTNIKDAVKERYGAVAASVGASTSCCGSGGNDPITSGLYNDAQAREIPTEALLASLGCGNPTLLAQLNPGETVLDLGSGGGIDVLLSARRVSPGGKAYGLDMTDEMLALARANQARAGVENVEFLKGEIESIPLPEATVDVIISNCVINLSSDKGQVLKEAYRVLKPGGRFAVSDVVRRRADLPEDLAKNVELWIGCIAGALHEDEYKRLLAEAGFADISVEPTRIYSLEDATSFLRESGYDVSKIDASVDGAFMSAFVRATKPLR